MGMLIRGNEITLDDNSKYIIVDSFLKNNKNYIYMISEDDGKTTMIVEHRDGEIVELDDQNELDMVYKELIERNKEEIERYIEENSN
jgi:hypothetical protein